MGEKGDGGFLWCLVSIVVFAPLMIGFMGLAIILNGLARLSYACGYGVSKVGIFLAPDAMAIKQGWHDGTPARHIRRDGGDSEAT